MVWSGAHGLVRRQRLIGYFLILYYPFPHSLGGAYSYVLQRVRAFVHMQLTGAESLPADYVPPNRRGADGSDSDSDSDLIDAGVPLGDVTAFATLLTSDQVRFRRDRFSPTGYPLLDTGGEGGEGARVQG